MKIIISCSPEAITHNTIDYKLHEDILTLFFRKSFEGGIDQIHDVHFSRCVETLWLGYCVFSLSPNSVIMSPYRNPPVRMSRVLDTGPNDRSAPNM